ncbi:hypothetical protein M436DRAFT_60180 [Aureobasidium namibiae CBS 147.97]|uniref:Uncharacterized protein n=1 Tax=Aureobasidium namibiae CBS 147.97 TaxID=1043004 RepID=A0A074X3D5_9PEZI
MADEKGLEDIEAAGPKSKEQEVDWPSLDMDAEQQSISHIPKPSLSQDRRRMIVALFQHLDKGSWLLVDVHPWNEISSLADDTWFIDVQPELARLRIAQRHVPAGIEPDMLHALARADKNDMPNGARIRALPIPPRYKIQSVESQPHSPPASRIISTMSKQHTPIHRESAVVS